MLAGAVGALGAGIVAAAAVRDGADPAAHGGTIHTNNLHGGISHSHEDKAHDHPVMAHAMDEETIREVHRPTSASPSGDRPVA